MTLLGLIKMIKMPKFSGSLNSAEKKAVYKPGFRETDGDTIIVASSYTYISTFITPLSADPSIFKYVEWKLKLESVISSGDIIEKDGDEQTDEWHKKRNILE